MKKSVFDDIPDVYLETVRKRKNDSGESTAGRQRRKRKSFDEASNKERFEQFMKQEVSTDDLVLIPPEYAGITIFVLFLFLPKLVGMGFFFFYVSGGNIDTYHHVHTGGSLLDWVIGYEILAALALLVIFKKLISFVLGK
jgi:hypothetical protein